MQLSWWALCMSLSSPLGLVCFIVDSCISLQPSLVVVTCALATTCDASSFPCWTLTHSFGPQLPPHLTDQVIRNCPAGLLQGLDSPWIHIIFVVDVSTSSCLLLPAVPECPPLSYFLALVGSRNLPALLLGINPIFSFHFT